jgi:ubiquinone/menaquinone biosynthesis C-methylase UbiE
MSQSALDVERKQLEAEFHDQREHDRLRLSTEEFEAKYPNKKFYYISKQTDEYELAWLKKHAPGKKALDYCSGLGHTSLKLAEIGADVYGIDISPNEVASAKKLLQDNGFNGDNIVVGDAEKTDFPDNFFDVVVCNGVLHHLDVTKAFPELCRILKPSGKIIAMEALGYNPLIQLYRRRTPHLRTAWETEHILTNAELRIAKKYFDNVSVKYFHLATLAAIPFIGSALCKPLVSVLGILDSILLKIPFLQLMAWQMIFVLENPKK